MRIVIDLQGAQGQGSTRRGIGRYTLSLAKAMIHNRKEHEILLALNGMFEDTIAPIRMEFKKILPKENIRIWQAVSPVNGFRVENTWRCRTAELMREAFLESLNPDIVHISSFFEGYGDDAVNSIGLVSNLPTAVTLYDLIPLIHSTYYLDPYPKYKAFYMRKLDQLKQANLYLAISEFSRQEAVKYLGIKSSQVINISAAASDIFAPLDMNESEKLALRKRLGLLKPFIMNSGATDERKNHLRLIKAFSLLPAAIRNSLQLAIVGELPDKHKKHFESYSKECGLSSSDVVITGWIRDADIVRLYNMCELFVFPSWHEGFGLPALEAMKCGAPVIASDTSSLPEVIGRRDVLFNPFDELSITHKMTQVLSDKALQADLHRYGQEQAKKFSWDNCAKAAIDAFEQWHQEVRAPEIRTQPAIEQNLIDTIATLHVSSVHEADLLKAAECIALNHPQVAKKQLLIDVSIISRHDGKSGIQRVVQGVIEELLSHPPEGYILRFIAGTSQLPYRYISWQNIEAVPYAEIIVRPGDIFLGLDLATNAVAANHKQLAAWKQKGVKVYFVVYDLLPVLHPEWFTPKAVTAYKRWIAFVALLADSALCISRVVAQDLQKWCKTSYNIDLSTHTIPMGWNFNVSRSKGMPPHFDDILMKIQKHPAALIVGTIEPRKGHLQVLEAFEMLWNEGKQYNLVIIGRPGWKTEALQKKMYQHPQRDKCFFWFDDASDEVLFELYKACEGVIVASLAEGFGLPLIEALGLGKPVLARDLPVFRERKHPLIHYFNTMDAKIFSNEIVEWLGDISTISPITSLQEKVYSWEKSVITLVSILDNVVQ